MDATLPQFFIDSEGFSQKQLRLQGRSDDEDRRALGSIQSCDLWRKSSLLHDLRVFPLLKRDVSGRRDNCGRTHS